MTGARGLLSGLLAGAAGLLSACDDGTRVTRVDRMGSFSRSYLVTAAAGGGLPVIVHGAPFEGVAPEEVVARLSFPAGTLHYVDFRLAERGTRPTNRLVLVFNRADAPDGVRDCRGETPRLAGPDPGGTGFSAQATFCMGDRMQATGVLEATRTRAGDPQSLASALRRLLREIAGDIIA